MQNIWNFIVEKSTLQENGTSVIIREISDFKFIWKLGDAVQNLESAGFPGRVDSTVMILVHFELHCYGSILYK